MADSKLSPTERLLRKRKAARLRQQRCRERKRMTLIENATQENNNNMSSKKRPSSKPLLNKSSLPPRKLWKARILVASFQPRTTESWSDSSSSLRSGAVGRSSSFDTVTTTASFDSQQQEHYGYSPSRSSTSPSMDSRMSPLPIHFEHRFPPLPNKEEAAIDAMLALKSEPLHCPPTPTPIPPSSQFVYWDHYGRMAHHFHFHPTVMQGRYHVVPHAV